MSTIFSVVTAKIISRGVTKQRRTSSKCPWRPKLHLHDDFTYVLPFKMDLPVQIMAKLKDNVCIVSGVNLNYTFCFLPVFLPAINHEQ